MSALIRVWPVEGRLVRHPETGAALPEEGLEVRRSPFWLRRIRTGDVTTAPPAVAESTPAGAPAPDQDAAPTAALELSVDEEEAIASVAVEVPIAEPDPEAETDKPAKLKARRKDGRFAS